MVNQLTVLVISLLFSASSLQAMFSHHRDKKTSELDNKVPIKSLDDVKKIKEFQNEYRGKHGVFKDEPNNVKIEQVEKK